MLLLSLLLTSVAPYSNPVWNEDFPDPYVTQSGREFYAYATHRDQTGFQCLQSEDLIHWRRRPAVFKPSWSDEHYWAPEVHPWHNRWYLVYSAKNRTTHKHDVAIAVSRAATGPFRELGTLVRGNGNRVGDIDATLFFHGSKAYLLYSAEDPRSIQLVPLSPDLTHTVGNSSELLRPTRPEEKGITEAPSLVYRNNRFWLFYSTGWFQSYKRDACYQIWAASSASLAGPYAKPAKPLVTTVPGHVYSPGHQCVLDLASGQSWIFYHAWDSSAEPLYGQNKLGRTLRMDRLWWTASGPKTNAPTWTPQPGPVIHR